MGAIPLGKHLTFLAKEGGPLAVEGLFFCLAQTAGIFCVKLFVVCFTNKLLFISLSWDYFLLLETT